MGNAPQRDDIHGTPASASAELYRQRRQGNLTRASDGFRSPYPSSEPRRPADGGHKIDPPMAPYRPNPRPPESNVRRYPPRTWAFFRPASLGAPPVPFPDRERTRGRLQQSGEAWGSVNERHRPVLTPAQDGQNAPPSHRLGTFVPGRTEAKGSRWSRPSSPVLRDHMPH
jgi:hypothetical protein